ncbi:hypothetical protein [Streptomyces sp. NBC_01618]|uniref:hypothetical protein n=1 Tax=Streptomyces sp. NBC_01618 TaxID=2975900 RepID=UPI00386717CE|nr:hypothetical protein OH735_28120 [Streptomyces sp. NBC_01618]
MTSNGTEAAEQGWDAPWYRVRTERFQASFLPSANEPLDAVCNVDVEVRLTADESRWSATVFTLAEVERLMEKDSRTGESLNGRYFWCSDGLIVRDPGIDNITHVLTGLLDCGDFTQVLQRLDDD